MASCAQLDSNPDDSNFQVTKSVHDSANEVKAIMGLFLSELSLPFSLGAELLNLCKRVNK